MKKRMGHFVNLERQIGVLMILVSVLFCLLAGYAIYLVYDQNFDKALTVSMPLGAMISALLVAKVAGRLLEYNDITREDDRHQDVVRITHHLLSVISDLRSRIGYAIITLRDGGRPLIALTENAAAIEKRYEVLLEREIYRFLNGETVELIGRMSGHIFGLVAFAKGLAEVYSGKPNIVIQAGTDQTMQKAIEGLESLLKDLDALDTQILQLRSTLD
jgi:hypothetical protein